MMFVEYTEQHVMLNITLFFFMYILVSANVCKKNTLKLWFKKRGHGSKNELSIFGFEVCLKVL